MARRGEDGSEIFDPGGKPKPPNSGTSETKKPVSTPTPTVSPIVGNWARVDKGNATCGKTTIAVQSDNGRLSGTSSFGGTLRQLRVSGRSFSFVEEYTDVFGKLISLRYSGELSVDGNSATASISGKWQGGCTSTFTRLN